MKLAKLLRLVHFFVSKTNSHFSPKIKGKIEREEQVVRGVVRVAFSSYQLEDIFLSFMCLLSFLIHNQ